MGKYWWRLWFVGDDKKGYQKWRTTWSAVQKESIPALQARVKVKPFRSLPNLDSGLQAGMEDSIHGSKWSAILVPFSAAIDSERENSFYLAIPLFSIHQNNTPGAREFARFPRLPDKWRK